MAIRAPVDKVVVASRYADPRRFPGAPGYPKFGPGPHWGTDLAGSTGTLVRAPEPMTVVDVRVRPDPEADANTPLSAPFDGYGPGVVLGEGLITHKFHLLAHVIPSVAKGDVVDIGDVVGKMASHVGGAGSHTHWEVRTVAIDSPSTRQANTVDPMSLVEGDAGQPPPDKPPPAGMPWWVWLLALWAASKLA